MVTMFAKSLPESKQALKSAYEMQDWNNIQKIVHRVKGETSYCGLKRLHQACFDLDKTIKANNDSAYEALYRTMFQVIDITLKTLETSPHLNT